MLRHRILWVLRTFNTVSVSIPSPIARLGLRYCLEVGKKIKLCLCAAGQELISCSYSLREKYSEFATPNLGSTRQPVFGIIILKSIERIGCSWPAQIPPQPLIIGEGIVYNNTNSSP